MPNTVAEEGIYFISNGFCSLLSSNALLGEFQFIGVSRMQDLNSIHSTISSSMLMHFQVLGYKLIHSPPNHLAEAMSKNLFSVGTSVQGLRNCFEGLEWEKMSHRGIHGGPSGQAVQRS